MIDQIQRKRKLPLTNTPIGNNSVPIITIQDDDNDYDIHDNYVDADITRRFLSFELCHLYHMAMSNLLERVCKAVMTMRGISVQKKNDKS